MPAIGFLTSDDSPFERMGESTTNTVCLIAPGRVRFNGLNLVAGGERFVRVPTGSRVENHRSLKRKRAAAGNRHKQIGSGGEGHGHASSGPID